MDSYVQLHGDQTGKEIRMFRNTIGGNTVNAMAITAINPITYSDSFVKVKNSTGKKMQYFQNTVGGNSVVALALVLVDSSGTPI